MKLGYRNGPWDQAGLFLHAKDAKSNSAHFSKEGHIGSYKKILGLGLASKVA